MAFQFFPCVDPTKSKKLSKLSRFDLGILVRYLTGTHLRRHIEIAKKQAHYVEFPEMIYSLEDPDNNQKIMMRY